MPVAGACFLLLGHRADPNSSRVLGSVVRGGGREGEGSRSMNDLREGIGRHALGDVERQKLTLVEKGRRLLANRGLTRLAKLQESQVGSLQSSRYTTGAQLQHTHRAPSRGPPVL